MTAKVDGKARQRGQMLFPGGLSAFLTGGKILIFSLALFIYGCGASSPSAGSVSAHPGADVVAPGDAKLSRIHPDVWVHVSTHRFEDGTVFPANGLIVRDGEGLFLVDSAWGETATRALLNTIESEIGLPVHTALVTHFHDDRVSGVDVLEGRGVDVYGTSLTGKLAAAAGNPGPSAQIKGLDKAGSAVLVGPVEVFFPGAGHTRDNLMVYVPGAGVLFGGCAVHEQSRTNAGNVADADLASWPQAIRRVRARYPGVKIVVPGHGEPGAADLLDHTISLIEAHRQSQ